MAIDAKTVKSLREETGLPMMQCKKALEESAGDLEKAKEFLRKQGAKMAEKRGHRETSEGTIGNYLHHDGRTGVLLELNCETDFVARSEDFTALARDLALHVAFHDPVAIRREEVPAEVVEKERELILGQMDQDEKTRSKPEEVRRKIAEGRLDKFYAERVLLEQPFVRDPSGRTTVKDLIQQTMQKTGENISVRRFVRYRIGD